MTTLSLAGIRKRSYWLCGRPEHIRTPRPLTQALRAKLLSEPCGITSRQRAQLQLPKLSTAANIYSGHNLPRFQRRHQISNHTSLQGLLPLPQSFIGIFSFRAASNQDGLAYCGCESSWTVGIFLISPHVLRSTGLQPSKFTSKRNTSDLLIEIRLASCA
jgi:hypothetical protein